MARAHILALPQEIRFRIYQLACILNESYVDFAFNYEDQVMPRCDKYLAKWSNSGTPFFRDSYRTYRAELFKNAILTCRTFYEEVGSLMYSNTHFVFRYQFLTDMDLIKDLRPPSLRHLRKLTLRLAFAREENESPLCVLQIERKDRNSGDFPYHKPLDDSDMTQRIVDEWRDTANFLSEHVPPSQLCLNILFDCHPTAYRAAEEFCEITAGLSLRVCQIRLSHKFDKDLSLLAERTALQATGRSNKAYDDDKPFRFTNLPKEIQIEILEYTDLVAPLRMLEYIYKRDQWKITLQPPHTIPCRHSHHLGVHNNICRFTCCQVSVAEGCYCRIDHSAYSPFCECWQFPASIFSVSRSFNAITKEIFFTSNRFILDHGQGTGKYVTNITNPDGIRLQPTRFFTKVLSLSAAHHLRKVELAIPRMDPRFLDTNHRWYLDWAETFRDMAESWVGTPSLTLILYNDHWYDFFSEEYPGDLDEKMEYYVHTSPDILDNLSDLDPSELDPQEARIYWTETYLKIAATLAEAFSVLRSTCLRDFFLFFAYPHLYDADLVVGISERRMNLLMLTEHYEREIEKQVMGDNYDAMARGKYSSRKGLWYDTMKYFWAAAEDQNFDFTM